MVWVKGGPKLFGVLKNRDEAGNVRLLVDRAWLRATAPEFYKRVTSFDSEAEDAQRKRTLDRIVIWRAERESDVGMRIFLDKEQERIEGAKDKAKGGAKEPAADDSKLMVVEVLADEMRSAYAQPPARRQLMLAALNHDVERAISRTPQALQRELEALRVDWQKETAAEAPDAKLVIDSDYQWAARQALVEYRHRQPLNFQGAGTFIARTGKGAEKKPLEEVLTRVLQDQLAASLNIGIGSEGPKKADSGAWLEQAVRVAEKEGVRGFRVARLEKDVARDKVTVTIGFYAKLPDRSWTPVFESKASKSITDVKPESLEEIAGAEDVKRIMELLSAIGGGGGDVMKRALSFGAAAKEAMNEAHLGFVTELNRYVKRLDQPSIRLK